MFLTETPSLSRLGFFGSARRPGSENSNGGKGKLGRCVYSTFEQCTHTSDRSRRELLGVVKMREISGVEGTLLWIEMDELVRVDLHMHANQRTSTFFFSSSTAAFKEAVTFSTGVATSSETEGAIAQSEEERKDWVPCFFL